MTYDGTWPLLAVAALMGVRHAFEGDHIAAVATIAAGGRGWRDALQIGAIWGIGHTAALLVATAALVGSRSVLSDGAVTLLEAAIGALIIALALKLLADLWRGKVHLHRHSHGRIEHVHLHEHGAAGSGAHHHPARVISRPFAMGAIHGAAGSAALLVTTVAATASMGEAVLAVVVFGVGSVAGMALASSLITAPIIWSAKRGEYAFQLLTGAIALGSAVFGGYYCYSALSG